MNFKKPVVQRGGKGSTEELLSIGIIKRKDTYSPHVFRLNKAFYENRKVKNLAFSIEKNTITVLINTPEEIPSYKVKVTEKNGSTGQTYIISNIDLCNDIIKALNIDVTLGTVYFKPIPITKYQNLDTFRLEKVEK